tara:strand:+ start:196 stop:429 length:234 start_codon:yes stop_codon:yes gene_type:complete
MADDRRYMILELATQGWSLIDKKAQNLTRVECDKKLQEYINIAGIAPERLKVAAQGDLRYAGDNIDPEDGFIPQNTQ